MQVRLPFLWLISPRVSVPRAKRLAALSAWCGLLLASSPAARADVTKANNTDALNLGTSYVGGATPLPTDRLLIDSTLAPATAGNPTAAPLGANLSVLGILVTNPSGPLTISNTPGATLSIGASGIDLTAATANLTIQNNINLTANQTWNVGNGFTLAAGNATNTANVSNSAITGSAALTLGGAGGTIVINSSFGGQTFTGSSGVNTITYTGTTTIPNVVVGQSVTGTGIATNAYITAISGNTITLSAANTAAVATATVSGNTYSGGTVLNAGIIQLGTGAPAAINTTATSGLTTLPVTGNTLVNGVFGTGAVTINNGVTIAASSQQNSVAATQFNIAGNFTLGTAAAAARMAFNGVFDMGGATRTITLNKASTSIASGNEILSVGTRAGAGFLPTFQNGAVDFEAGPLAAPYVVVADVVATNFVNNAGLIIGPNVIWTANAFGTASNAPALTVNGYFYSGTSTISRNTTVFSLSGNGLFTNATAQATNPIATLTISGSGTATFAGRINDGASQADANGNGNPLTAGTIDGTIALVKSGTGTQILTGTNTYSAGTTVSGGVLFINGANTGNGVNATTGVPLGATVNSGGTLGGSGSIASVVTINAGGILQGGGGAVGSTFTISNNLTLADSSTIKLTLGVGGQHSSLARTGGTWTFAPVTQQFAFDGNPTVGFYDNIITGLTANPTGSFVLPTGYTGTFAFDGANVDLTLTAVAVPEPSTWAMLAVGAAGLLIVRRRRQTALERQAV